MRKLHVALVLWLPVLALASEGFTGPTANRDPDEEGARFTNQWVVQVDGTVSDARAVARQHGFEYMRQVPGFDNHHLMRRPEKIDHYHAGHHKRLRRSSQVMWAQQEKVKVRKKRRVRFNDKMYPLQWYLRKGAKNGFDMNVRAAWDLGYTGKGVVVTILDDGLDYSHPDLKQNYDAKASYDVNDHDRDPMPRSTFDNENKHGTRCAGEVAATANNHLCNVGVAFNSKIGGVRMLDGDITDSVEGASLGLNQNYIDIYSGSWGPDDNGKVVDGPGVMARSAFERGVRSGRKGLGNIFIWASGNGGSSHDSCACDGYAGSIYTLSVSSVSEQNKKPWYLEECASTLASTYSSGYAGDRQVVTTDLHHMCTDKHTGTSASAPMAAGIIALVLEANRNLTWRDVQYLTVITADPRPFLDASWITNGVGRKVSLLYGYGLMDAGRMVYLARLWRRVPAHRLCDTGSVQFFKPIYGKTTVTASFHTNGCAASGKKQQGSVVYVEQVLLYLNLTFTRRGELRIALVSPAGTRSVLLPPRSRDIAGGNTKFDQWPLASAQFWGERAAGEWRLEVENTGATHNSGRLSSGKLMLYGVDSPPIRLRRPRKTPPTWFQKEFIKLVVPGGLQDDTTARGANGQLLCHPECRNSTACSGPGPTQCHGGCRKLKMAANGACVAACPLGSFPNSGVCETCHLRCEACSGPGPHNCTTCPTGSTLVESEKRCLDVGERCPTKTYLASGVCWPCPETCAECEVSERCLSCRQDNGTLVLAPNGQCLRNCPAKYYVSPDKRCLPCEATCAACISAFLDGCISCPPTRLLLKTNRNAAVGHCITDCPAGYFLAAGRRECVRCHVSCATCKGPEATACNSCRPGLVASGGSCLDPVTIKCKSKLCLPGSDIRV